MKSFYYKCESCSEEVAVSETYYRRLNSMNPNRICRVCTLRGKEKEYLKKWDITETGRKCVQCASWKLYSEFPGIEAKRVRHNGICKDCRNKSFSTKWGTDPEFKRITQERAYRSSIKIKYGLTPEQHRLLLEKHNHQCYVCSASADLVIDHCHVSNKVRGILCRNCNKALGIFKDSSDLLLAAVRYLNETSS